MEDYTLKAPGSDSPWGKVTNWTTLCPGVFSITTAWHGGIEVDERVAHQVFSSAALQYSFFDIGSYWFDKNRAIFVAYRELMDKGILSIPKYLDPGEFERNTNKCIQRDFPEYWQAREKMLAQKDSSASVRPAPPKRKERER